MSTTDKTSESTGSDDDRELFERLAENFEGQPVGEIAETVLQSLDSEEANS